MLLTFNGAAYLREQIESIIRQSYTNWQLLIRDDGSRDGTQRIIREYCLKYPDKIRCIEYARQNIGIANSAMQLLQHSDADYLMFCDQDDIWLPEKVELMIRAIQKKEREYTGVPLLVHCEAIVVHNDLIPVEEIQTNAISAKINGYDKHATHFANLLFLNVVQAASMIMNKSLREKLACLFHTNLDRNLIHDSIIASVASICGKIFFLNKALMYYRQHEKNAVGAAKIKMVDWLKLSEKERDNIRWNYYLRLNHPKMKLLRKKYMKEMDETKQRVFEHFDKNPNCWGEFVSLGLHKVFGVKKSIVMAACGIM